MTITVYLAPFVMVLGGVAYKYSKDAKISDMGRIAFALGLFVTLLQFAGHITKLL